MSQAPRSQNEITNVVKKFPNLVSWVEDLQKRVKELENPEITEVVETEVVEVKEYISLEEFNKFQTKISNLIKELDPLKSLPKEIASFKREIEGLKEKIKVLETANKKETAKTKNPETTETQPK